MYRRTLKDPGDKIRGATTGGPRRHLLRRRFWKRIAERQARYGKGAITAWNVSVPPDFIDYWQEIPATFPEKLVFAELVRRQVNFYFSWYMGDMPITPSEYERMRPDFYLPDYKIIIEVYGIYWHTRPGSFEHDAYRAMLLMASGFQVYILNDFEVMMNAKEAVDRIPELRAPLIHGNMHMVGDRPFNPTASIASRMQQWPKVGGVSRTKRIGSKAGVKPISSWKESGAAVTRPPPTVEPMVFEIFPELLEAAMKWKEAFERWLEEYDWWLAQYEEWVDAYFRFFGYMP